MKSNRVFSLGKECTTNGSIVSAESESSRETKKPHRQNDEACCLGDSIIDYSFTLVPSSSGSQ